MLAQSCDQTYRECFRRVLRLTQSELGKESPEDAALQAQLGVACEVALYDYEAFSTRTRQPDLFSCSSFS